MFPRLSILSNTLCVLLLYVLYVESKGGKGKLGVRTRHVNDAVDILGRMSNVSTYDFLMQGCFIKRYFEYCSNRLTDYSCVYWLNLNTEKLETAGFLGNTALSGRAKKKLQNFLERRQLRDDMLKAKLLGNTTLPIPDISIDEVGDYYFECEEIFGENIYPDDNMLILYRLLPPIMLLIIVFQVCTCILLYKLAHRSKLPLCIYGSMLAIFEAVIVGVRLGELAVYGIFGLYLTPMLLLFSVGHCQLMNFCYSFFTHFYGMIHVAVIVDLYRLVKRPVNFLKVYTRDWVRNSTILMLVILLIVNCQFLWTFSITKNKKKFILGNSKLRGFTCSYADNEKISDYYVAFVWPLLDSLFGDMGPVMITFVVSLLILKHYRKMSKRNEDAQLKSYVIDVAMFNQVRRVFLYLSLFYVLTSVPQALYFLGKYLPSCAGKISDLHKKTLSKNVPHAVKPQTNVRESDARYQLRSVEGSVKCIQIFGQVGSIFIYLIFCPEYRRLFVDNIRVMKREFHRKYSKRRYSYSSS